MDIETTAETPDQTRSVAREVVSSMKRSAAGRSRASVLALSGPLGAGKTAFAKHVADSLGVTATVTSPTFVLRIDHATPDPVFGTMSHIDAYRMDSPDEILAVGWDDILSDSRRLAVVEWPERVSEHLPADRHAVSIRFSGRSRLLTVTHPV